MNDETKRIVNKLELASHPEGGYFKEIYRSDDFIGKEFLPGRYTGKRVFSTSIYYLLYGNHVSNFHRLKSDETWHFYSGVPTIIHCLYDNSIYEQVKIGLDLEQNIFPQFTIKKGTWFAAEVSDKNSYSLIGCTVAPGFEYDDFELAERNQLMKLFPIHKNIIERFTKS